MSLGPPLGPGRPLGTTGPANAPGGPTMWSDGCPRLPRPVSAWPAADGRNASAQVSARLQHRPSPRGMIVPGLALASVGLALLGDLFDIHTAHCAPPPAIGGSEPSVDDLAVTCPERYGRSRWTVSPVNLFTRAAEPKAKPLITAWCCRFTNLRDQEHGQSGPSDEGPLLWLSQIGQYGSPARHGGEAGETCGICAGQKAPFGPHKSSAFREAGPSLPGAGPSDRCSTGGAGTEPPGRARCPTLGGGTGAGHRPAALVGPASGRGSGGVVVRVGRHPIPPVCSRLHTSGPPHSAGEGYGCQTSLMDFTLPSPSSVMS